MALTASRAKPQLAPSQQYESLARWVLNTRLWTLSVYTGVGVVVSTSLLAILTQYTISFSALLTVPTFSVMMCGGFLLPLVLLRKWDLQPTYVPPTSWRAQVSTLVHKPSTYRTIGIAATSTAAYALLNCLCAASLGAHKWPLFAPTKRHPMHLNENVIILMLGNALVGTALATKDLLTNRAVVKWPSKISLRTHSILNHASLSFTIGFPILIALLVSTNFLLGYWMFRKTVYRALLRLPLLGLFLKPFIIQAARPSTTISLFYLFTRITILAIVTTIHYEHAQAFFDSIAGRGMLVARDSVSPDECLRSGMEASEYYQHFSYLELAHLARKGPRERRAPVFADPTKWHFISRSCLKLLGRHYGHLKRRGAPAPPPPAPKPAPSSALSSALGQSTPFGSSKLGSSTAYNLQTPTKRIPLIPNLNSSVYKPVPPPSPGAQFLKSLLSSSTISPATTSSDVASPPSTGNGAATDGAKSPVKGSMPGVFVMMAPEEKARLAAAGKAQGAAGAGAPAAPAPRSSVLGLLWKGILWVVRQITARVPSAPTRADGEPFVKMPWLLNRARWWFEVERDGRKVRGLLVGKEMDCLCVQTLTGFTTASLKEDAYGTLQQDIPKILEALTRMLLALEEYSLELRTAATTKDAVGDAPSGFHVFEAEIAIDEFITPYVNEIIIGLRDVMTTFGDRLNVFRLPMSVARRLQHIATV